MASGLEIGMSNLFITWNFQPLHCFHCKKLTSYIGCCIPPNVVVYCSEECIKDSVRSMGGNANLTVGPKPLPPPGEPASSPVMGQLQLPWVCPSPVQDVPTATNAAVADGNVSATVAPYNTNTGAGIRSPTPPVPSPTRARASNVSTTVAPCNGNTEARMRRPTPSHGPVASAKRRVYLMKGMRIHGIKQRCPVTVPFIYSGSRFHINGTVDEAKQHELQEKINNGIQYGLFKQLKESPVPGEVLVAKNLDNNTYGRVLVTSIEVVNGVGLAHFEFVEFGGTGAGTYNKLLIPTDNIMQEPLYGLAVKLAEIPEGIECPKSIADLVHNKELVVEFVRGPVEYDGIVAFDVPECGAEDGFCLNFAISIMLNN